jgi:two-component system, chemotaxis family, protein-glutamate methylesterase/glutaminase
VIIVQHMPTRFTRTFAERLDRLGGVRVTEASEGDRLRAGRALVCPGGRCLEVHRAADGLAVRVLGPVPEDRYVPSADRVFHTAAVAAGERVVAVILTGMGDDGMRGVESVKGMGGRIYVQAPDDAVVDGMPRSAIKTGAADHILPLKLLSEELSRLLAP